jgi:phage tail-like protein
MAVIGKPRNYYKKFKFIVEIDGIGSAKFQSCSELSAEAAEVMQWEGGALLPEKDPGRITVADLTLERGATKDKDLFNWFGQVVRMSQQAGLVTPDFKRNLSIVQLDRDNSTSRRWRVYGAWPKKMVVSAGWDNTADENVMESVVLTYNYFETN